MTEAVLQTDLQRELLRLTATFSAGDVVINDWSVLDGGNDKAPYVNIETAETFDVATVQSQFAVTWNIPFSLIVKFVDWDTSRNAIATHRATILTALMDVDHYHESSALLSYGIRSIRGVGEAPIYDRYPEEGVESLPVFLSYRMALTAIEIRRT